MLDVLRRGRSNRLHVLAAIVEAGPDGIGKYDLDRKSRTNSSASQHEILPELIRCGLVSKDKVKSDPHRQGARKHVYTATESGVRLLETLRSFR